MIVVGDCLTLEARSRYPSRVADSTLHSATCYEGSLHKSSQMTSYNLKRYKHLPKFGYFVYNCHFPNKSVNHSESPYAVPEDYKDDDDFLQHYRSLRLSHNTDIDYICAFPHFYYVVDLYKAIAYNRPRPDPTPYIQRRNAYHTSRQQLPPQPIKTVRNYRYIDVEIGSIHPYLVLSNWN